MKKLVAGIIHNIRDDRRLLTRVIFPWVLEKPEFKKVLFVGCKWHTRGYNETFRNRDYWTLEIVPDRRDFGAKQHITDSMANIHLHFKENEVDVIFLQWCVRLGPGRTP